MRCLLIGNYGVSNVGDEALKDYFLARFPEIEWQVVSAHPIQGELPRLPAGVRSLLTTPWWRTFSAMRRADAVVFGGGSLFTDVESSFACFLWWLHAATARFLGKPVVLAFQGIGPFRTKRGKGFAKRAIRLASFCSVRDAESVARIAAWDMNISCIQSADPIFIVSNTANSARAQNMLAVIPRHNADAAFHEAFSAALQADTLRQICIVSMQPEDAAEQAVIEEMKTRANGRARVVRALSMRMLLEALGEASSVLTQRYHGAIAALALGIPVTILPQGTGDKLWALRELIHGKDPKAEAARLREAALRGEKALKQWFVSCGINSAANPRVRKP
jgi:polysaccharide pyruvyl transferase WcaK-like protein